MTSEFKVDREIPFAMTVVDTNKALVVELRIENHGRGDRLVVEFANGATRVLARDRRWWTWRGKKEFRAQDFRAIASSDSFPLPHYPSDADATREADWRASIGDHEQR